VEIEGQAPSVPRKKKKSSGGVAGEEEILIFEPKRKRRNISKRISQVKIKRGEL